MDRWHSIQLGSLWLTDGNTSGGTPIINEIEGISVLKRGKVGQAIVALDGTVWKQRYSTKGAPLSIRFNRMQQADFESLAVILNNCDSGSDIAFQIDGDTGTYYGTVTTADEYLEFNSTFLNGRVEGVVANLIIATQNFQLTASPGSILLTGAASTLTQA